MPNPETKGIILIDKPAGISSFAVIKELRKITGIKKIGHTGTLDPFASGLLICLLGSYTRLASIGEAENKSYTATVQLGQQTNTADTEGEVIATAKIPESLPDINQIISDALELECLPVPAFSAIKINGKRAYKYAREEISIQMPIRSTRILSFEFILFPDGSIMNSTHQISYCCTVSKGTYIRSLSEWLANRLGTVGHTISLRRTSIGMFHVDNAIPLSELSKENWQENLSSYKVLLHEFPAYTVNADDLPSVLNGNAIPASEMPCEPDKPILLLSSDGELLALGKMQDNHIKPYLVLA